MANKEHREERSQVLLQSNCKRYLDVLVPSALAKPVTEYPQIIITVDDRYLHYFQGLRKEQHTVIVELETLKKLSPNWLILPIFGLHLDIDLRKVPNNILPTILGILRGFGHVGYLGYHLEKSDNYEIKKDLSSPTSVESVLEVLRRLEDELPQGASTIGGFSPRKIVSHAIDFICHIFKWYDEPTYGYYSRNSFEQKLDSKQRLELERLEKSLGDWRRGSVGRREIRKGERKSQRLAIQSAKPQGISKSGHKETNYRKLSKKQSKG